MQWGGQRRFNEWRSLEFSLHETWRSTACIFAVLNGYALAFDDHLLFEQLLVS